MKRRKAIAHEVGSNFFSISSADLSSMWRGESEKAVKALFAVARVKAPSIVFLDECETLMAKRSGDDRMGNGATLTEFLQRMDGFEKADEPVLVVGATNLPWTLDDAIVRRFEQRLLIPLPDEHACRAQIERLMVGERLEFSVDQVQTMVDLTKGKGYSGSDLFQVCKEFMRRPLLRALRNKETDVRQPPTLEDFRTAVESTRCSVPAESITRTEEWNSKHGTK